MKNIQSTLKLFAVVELYSNYINYANYNFLNINQFRYSYSKVKRVFKEKNIYLIDYEIFGSYRIL